MSPTRSLVSAAVLGLAATTLTATPANGAPPYREKIHEEYAAHLQDFCGAEGLEVDLSGVFESRLKILTKHSGLDYFAEHITNDQTITGSESGVTVTVHTAYVAKDLKVVDNGDGTLTITQLLTGPSTLYGPNGKAIARDPGQVRFRLVIDTNGTPADPEDDFEVSFEQVKGSTGRTDDYCAAMVEAIG